MADKDWSEWGELWKQQPAIDVPRLRRVAARKRLRMQATVVLELLTTSVALVQILRLFGGCPPRWRLWCLLSLVFVLVLQALYLHIRRGTWRASGSDVPSMLALTISRAKAGMRLARLNIWGTLAWVMVTLVAAAPELEPSLWRHDAKLKLMLTLQFAVNAPLIIALIAFCAWYIRRQRKRLRHANTLLEQLRD
jgi:hypothetical protein